MARSGEFSYQVDFFGSYFLVIWREQLLLLLLRLIAGSLFLFGCWHCCQSEGANGLIFPCARLWGWLRGKLLLLLSLLLLFVLPGRA